MNKLGNTGQQAVGCYMAYIHHRHLLLLSSKADTHFTVPRRVEGWVNLYLSFERHHLYHQLLVLKPTQRSYITLYKPFSLHSCCSSPPHTPTSLHIQWPAGMSYSYILSHILHVVFPAPHLHYRGIYSTHLCGTSSSCTWSAGTVQVKVASLILHTQHWHPALHQSAYRLENTLKSFAY